MLNQIFLALSLSGGVWVLYLLVILSVISIALIFERATFYRKAESGLESFRRDLRLAVRQGNIPSAQGLIKKLMNESFNKYPNMEMEMSEVLLSQSTKSSSPEALNELALDALIRAKLSWDRNLSMLATIGSNAPFIGLFGTVLGIIQAFHDLSSQAATSSMHTVTAGISESLVATAVGILVAIPATIAYNLFLRKVKAATQNAESLKSFLIGNLLSK